MKNLSFKEITNILRQDGDFDEEAYKRLQRFLRPFLYYIHIGIISLLILEALTWGSHRATFVHSIIVCMILLYLHLKAKRESEYITMLYSLGEITSGKIEKALPFNNTGWLFTCSFDNANRHYVERTLLYDYWDGISIYIPDSKPAYIRASFRTVRDKSFVGQNILILLPKSISENFTILGRYFTLKPYGYTIVSKEQLERYCLSHKRRKNFKNM